MTPPAMRPVRRRVGRAARAGLLAAAVLLAAGPASGQARLRVLADSVSIGERFRVSVAVDHPPGQSAVFPDVPLGSAEAGPLLALGDGVEAFTSRRFPPIARGGARTDSVVYEAAAFAADTARVGPVRVRLVVGTDTVTVVSNSILVPVRSETRGEAEPAPAPVGPPEPFPNPTALWIALGVLGMVLVGVAVWGLRSLLRTPRRGAGRPGAYPEALARLGALDRDPPETTEAVVAQFDALREAVRTYLARRLHLPARETTSDELAVLLDDDARVPEEGRRAVRTLLRATDLVAFAGLRPGPAAAADAREKARLAVETIEAALREQEAEALAASKRAPVTS